MPEGIIVKALSGYYYVKPEGTSGHTVQCRARGIFKKRGESPLVGDRVRYEVTENGEGTVDEIMPRTTELIRPPVANVNQAFLAFSLVEPDLNLQLLDKFLVHTEKAGLETIICFTKLDLFENSELASEPGEPSSDTEPLEATVRLYERIGYRVIVTSTKTDEGIAAVRDALSGRITVFSGQSGVGKSSLVNALVPGLMLETNAISMRLGRGKHTTRHVELIELEGGALVADTPGFSQLDFVQMEPEELSDCFVEMKQASAGCKFRGCLHHHEPGCQVKKKVEDGEIAKSRYDHYLEFLQEMKDRKRRY
ncbi:MAG: GTPase RsgA [Paenibacillus sp.]|jgi:ribosome biogenesis GTPase|nr:GTPase RsgA [Paenibacillus sp.]